MKTYRTTKEIAKTIREELKKEFPAYKFSVTCTYNSITVALMAGENPFANDTDIVGNKIKGYAQLNRYYITQDHHGNWISNGVFLTERAAQMLKRVVKISLREHYDNSDPMVDYFYTNYYLYLHIGKWDKPFTVTK